MALPRQVQEAADAADALLAQTNTPPPEGATTVEVPAEPPPEPALSANPPPAEPKPVPQVDIWEERYKTLQGLFNKEVPSLQGQVKTLQAQLQDAVARLEKASEAREQPVTQVTDPKDVENFGTDLVDMVNRVAKTSVERVMSAIDRKLALVDAALQAVNQRMDGTAKSVELTAEQLFFRRLRDLVPDWETTNADKRFLSWLTEVDPVYGVPRQSALANAQRALDAERVAAVFNAFTGPKPTTPTPNPVDKQVSPRGVASAAPAPNQPRIFRASEYADFERAKRAGAYRGREKDAAQFEAEFNLALSEGRVIS